MESVMTGPGWSSRVGWATQVDKIIKFGENFFAFLTDTQGW